ncbi:MAG TPA: MFS transporter [Pseudonocardia sp.]|jgi:MFS family permease|nr:MFS transporter [Pseudonocardia sp.]
MAGTLASFLGNTAHTLAAANVLVTAGKPALVPVLMFVSTVITGLSSILTARFFPHVAAKKSVLFVDGFSGVVVALLCIALSMSVNAIACIFVVEALLATGSAVYFSASRTLVSELVSTEGLAKANAGLGFIYQLGTLLGGVVGLGLIRLFGPVVGFAVNSLSYLVSFVLILTIWHSGRGEPTLRRSPGNSTRRDESANISTSRRMRTIADGAVMIGYLCVFEVFTALGPGLTAYHYHHNPSDFGLLQAAFAVGSLVAIAVLPRIALRHGSAIHLLLPLTGVAIVMLPQLGWLASLTVATFAGFSFQGWTVFQTRMQNRLHGSELNRVLALVGGAQKVASSLTFLVAAAVTGSLGVRLGVSIPVLMTLVLALPLAVMSYRARHVSPLPAADG